MSEERLEALRRMLRDRPEDARFQFGLAVELLNQGRTREGAQALEDYLALAQDEGNAWGRLGAARADLGEVEEAREAYARGIAEATSRGHETLVEEFEEALRGLA